jgi:hypothetical protein
VPVLTLSGSTEKTVQAAASGKTAESSSLMVGMANPFSEYKTQAEAEKAAGFALPFPALAPERYSRRVYRAIPGELLEIICYDKDGNDYHIREGAVHVQLLDGSNDAATDSTKAETADADNINLSGTSNENGSSSSVLASNTDGAADISGDYNTYSDVQKWQIGPITVTEKGENGRTYDFTASYSGYAFSVTSRDGLSKDEVKALRKEFIEQYFPAVLEGQTRETVKAFLNSSFTLSYESRMTDGIMIYMDPEDKDYFLLISFGKDGKAVSCSYQYNEVYTIDADGVQ